MLLGRASVRHGLLSQAWCKLVTTLDFHEFVCLATKYLSMLHTLDFDKCLSMLHTTDMKRMRLTQFVLLKGAYNGCGNI